MKISVLGGGTSGLTTALVLKKSTNHSINIIKGKDIIGVGEGTTEHWRLFCDITGITFEELIKECDATFKYGVRFTNWVDDYYCHQISNEANRIPHLYNFPVQMKRYATGNSYDALGGSKDNRAYVDEENDSWYFPNQLHMDNGLLNDFLVKKCKENGIDIYYDEIRNVNIGTVVNYLESENQKYEADFFVDCSGFHKVLVSRIPDYQWISHKDHLLIDRAIPFQVHNIEEHDFFTGAIAMDHGWMWKIPTQSRTGMGYAYSSQHYDEFKAIIEIKEYMQDWKDTLRLPIIFEAGKMNKCVVKNVAALGLASNFFEPLEATNITSSILTAVMLANTIHYYGSPFFENTMNNYFDKLCENLSTFIQAHYLVEREDTDFWKSVKYESKPYDYLQELLEKVRHCGLLSDLDIREPQMLFYAPNFNQIFYHMGLVDLGVLRQKYTENLPKDYAPVINDMCMDSREYNDGPYVSTRECILAVRDNKKPSDLREKWNW